MADEFHSSGNWWDTTRNVRFESGLSPSSSALSSIGSFGWPADMAGIKARSSMESVSASNNTSSMANFHDSQKLQDSDSSATGDGPTGCDPNLQMMNLGLSSQALDWNQALLRGEKGETSFRSMLQENMNSNNNFQQETGQQQLQWRSSERIFSGDSSVANRGFPYDHQQQQFSAAPYSPNDSTVTCLGLSSNNFQMDSGPNFYGSPTMLQGLLVADHNQQQQQSSSANSMSCFPNYSGAAAQFGMNNNSSSNNDQILPSWSKVPQFLRTSPPKQQHSHLHFSNNTPFWNANSETAIKDTKPSFLPSSLHTQFHTPAFDEKPKNISEIRESVSVVKKSGNEPTSKRPRNETPSPLPAFKVRKEKMGDRITALQQLVSPFGKTDTASVLSEAIEYIKFLHEQVSALSTPYMKSVTTMQHQQNSDKSKDPEGTKQDLRSRGLCLVPVSSTFPVTHETTVDFWTPSTFGGTFR